MYIHKLLWYRGKHRVFLSGDYEFLSRAYGISGASGTCKNCVIWTLCLKTKLTMDGIYRTPDYQQFSSLGKGEIKQAKHYNNVISEKLFDIPISQVKSSNK
jgi:hypothetical protein